MLECAVAGACHRDPPPPTQVKSLRRSCGLLVLRLGPGAVLWDYAVSVLFPPTDFPVQKSSAPDLRPFKCLRLTLRVALRGGRVPAHGYFTVDSQFLTDLFAVR